MNQSAISSINQAQPLLPRGAQAASVVQRKAVTVKKVDGKLNLADLGTKPHKKEDLQKLKKMNGIYDASYMNEMYEAECSAVAVAAAPVSTSI